MEVEFADDDLRRLELDPKFTAGYSQAIVKAFRKRMAIIHNARDERDFYNLKSLHFEKLKGKRSHQHSMRLNDQWRLTLEIRPGKLKNQILVCRIEDYHGGQK
jgi:proteic killer suppression protein